jgi:Transposase
MPTPDQTAVTCRDDLFHLMDPRSTRVSTSTVSAVPAGEVIARDEVFGVIRRAILTHFAGLDVSVKDLSICIVDDTGKIVREVVVASEPEALLQVLTNPAYHFKRIGLEAGPLSQWLFSELAEAGLPVICVETRHMRAVLKAQINKTDRNDARGMAQMMRAGLYRPVHVKTSEAFRHRA